MVFNLMALMKQMMSKMIVVRVCVVLCCLSGLSCVGAKVPRERPAKVETKLAFKKNSIGKDHFYYTVELGERSIVWPDYRLHPKVLMRDRVYRLELVEEEHRSRLRKIDGEEWVYWSPELVKVFDGDKLLYDASICEVHKIAMERKAVRIIYGLIMYPLEYREARDKDFPNTGVSLGGCCVNNERTHTHRWVCKTCVTNKKQWDVANKKDQKDQKDQKE